MPGIDLDLDARVATLRLNKPRSLNALDESMLAEFESAIGSLNELEDVRALVITGSEGVFCVGLDLQLLRRAFGDLKYFEVVVRRFNSLLLALEELDLPVIAAVNGLTRAGGFELVLACDLVIVADEAEIGDVHTHFGIIPGGGGTQRAPRKLGDQVAKELIFTSRWLTGAQAVANGIAFRSVPAAELGDAVNDLTSALTTKPRRCLATIKQTMNDGAHLSMHAAIELEIDRFIDYLTNEPYAREGFNAYVEKRKPEWA